MSADPNKRDLLDKTLTAGAKKFGGAQGQKIAGDRAMTEKITDGLRKIFEKATGKKVSTKISN
ncbi:hypothetical protein GQ44DRAFT_769638 [Phaeosphaeriaceae sp. PMI808]|nr:hypothetical protein GQ44DRAFT_769638 [Phaeosphaeriaceae sp. PMI808]